MKKQTKHKILIVLFLVGISIPLLVQITGLENALSNNENRTITQFPKLDKKQPLLFLRNFKAYYKDNFGLRNSLSQQYIDTKFTVFNEDPIPEKVISGKNGFLFLGNSFSNVVTESLGFKLFNQNDLKTIEQNILKRKEWLNSQDIKFYVAVAPNKHTIYRENLPFKFPKKLTRKEQLNDYLQKQINFEFIDLGTEFKNKKNKQRLYRKYDSHWNDLGAFYATQTLLSTIQKDFKIDNLNLTNYKLDSVKTSGDLSKLINPNLLENKTRLTSLKKDSIITLNNVKYYKDVSIYESRHKNESKKFKILMFRDSFGAALKPFLNTTFGECTYIWSHKFDKDLILKEKPDIVIMEYAERYLESMQK